MKKYVIFLSVFLACVFFLYGCGAQEESHGSLETSRYETPDETEKNEASETVSNNTSHSSEVFDGEKLGYTAPEGWYTPRFTTGKVTGGDYKLEPEVMGLKVYYVQQRLEMWPSRWGYYRNETIDNVMWFQEENEIMPTGDVDLETWLAMGFDEKSWYELGTYVTPVKIKKEYTRDEIIKVFIDTAMEYLGTTYVVGASGKPGEGVDCSGLVLQCLYAIGIYPDGLDPVQHSTIEEYNSRLMWADPKFKEVSYNELQEGDLVFYGRPWSGRVCHVAIYIGGNECIEALNGDVEMLPLGKEDDDYTIVGYKRVIADG